MAEKEAPHLAIADGILGALALAHRKVEEEVGKKAYALVAGAVRAGRLQAFGEAVDLARRTGNHALALELEKLARAKSPPD